MRKTTTKHHVTIYEARPETFDERINEIIQDPETASYTITHDLGRPAFCAYIDYTTETVEYANIKEEMEANGERYYCDDCPYYVPPTDGRRKYGACKCGQTTPTKAACLLFYSEVARGEIEPRGGRP